ncbi:MAG: phospho-N-acetylmuramoyl-pentapeptide-transferase [Ruminococcaceae bacterium]|nr:phospho-N-acetylmuramoyl-pentapeptide-transferase [Oscillospiraceae bacterium]
MKDAVILFSFTAVLTFLITVLTSRKLIPYLKSKKMGQHILEIGPRWHKNKEGTPTMGGVAFIAGSIICGTACAVFLGIRYGAASAAGFVATLAYALACGLIGVADDLQKFTKKENEGLTAAQKYLLQLVASGAYLFALVRAGVVTTELAVPFTDITVDLGIFYYIVALLLLTGINNSVNLTDGIDGLASGVTFVVGVFFALVALLGAASPSPELASVAALLIGSTLGFLVYNFYPARVFMGDTGSLFLGGLVVGAAFLCGSPLVIVLCGIIYIVESASVILQVRYFKLTHGKRLFLMSPIHHHFEKKGWSEVKIVSVFSIVTALFCALAWFAL